ncbi:hypothetical protein T09_3558 [Trichinella sp. T9]|nr:hypothetical protein T09_3558 [Trichinella sp. T9]
MTGNRLAAALFPSSPEMDEQEIFLHLKVLQIWRCSCHSRIARGVV